MYRSTRATPPGFREYGVVPHCSVLPRSFIQTTAESSMSSTAGASARLPGLIRMPSVLSFTVEV
ncbi:hypothetical protein GCM10010446_64390 [Streptomyces enissocaesilis]|uniref:Uncharacterized protein n=1 Tax=Streptomyces enissocaesilis TaxID=332589 RepID=A0ABN3XMP8_9ACTN